MESYARISQAVLEARLNAMNMPVEWGGQGFSILQQVIALEQLGRVTNALWACVWRPAQVLEHCTPAQRARFLEPECRGERRYAYAITEPNAGSDVSRLETVARRVDGGWSISGEKWFVTDADIADYLIVVAEAEGHGQTASSSTATPPACARRAGPATCTRSCSSTRSTSSRTASCPTTRCSARPGRATSSPRTGSPTSA